LGKFQTSGKILWPCLEFFSAILKWMKIVFRGNPYDCWKKRHIFPGVGVFFPLKPIHWIQVKREWIVVMFPWETYKVRPERRGRWHCPKIGYS
jgi:hypothetical protein